MVFRLESIAKIESARQIYADLDETHAYTQTTNNILDDPNLLEAVESVLEPYVNFAENYVWRSGIADVIGVYRDAFVNAGMWGNRNIPGKRITTTIKYGYLGSVIYVEDEGNGFDYLAQINKLESGGRHDYQNNGGGMRKFFRSPLHIAYHGNGNKISIATRAFSKNYITHFSKKLK